MAAPGQALAVSGEVLDVEHVLEYTRPYLYPKQFEAIFDERRYSYIEASTKAGKAQPLDALVYTPTGPRLMGDIKTGDVVLTPGGRGNVVATYPQGVREILKVTFSDGSIVEADADHLWEVHQFARSPVVVTTEALQTWGTDKLRRAWVPETQIADFNPRAVPIDPYLLGALIGDGGMTGDSLMFSSADEEILGYVRAALPSGHNLVHRGKFDWCVSAGLSAAQLHEDGGHIQRALRGLGLNGKRSDDKFVPEDYRYNSRDVRIALLQGILDTHGFVDKHGQPAIEQTSQRLAEDIEEIVQSLGGTVLTRLRSQNGYRAKDGRFVICKPVWRQVIRVGDGSQLFRLRRKKDLCRSKRKTGHRMFRSIEFSRRAEAKCIELDTERQLYLTNGMVPTHNTSGCIVWLAEQAFAGSDGQNFWWVAPVSGQADIAFRRMMRAIPSDLQLANITLKTITLVNGAVIWFKSADKPDSLYGDDVHACVVDEASRVKEDAWYAVRSTLTATRGRIRLIGNVKGRKNWFFRLARKAEANDDPTTGYHKLTAHDAVAAGVLDSDEIEDAKRNLPDHVFRELYLAEASDDGGNPFGLGSIHAARRPMSSKPPAVWGIDLAKSLDWTVMVALDADGCVCRFHRFQLGWEQTVERVLNLVGRVPSLVDATGVGDPIVERLQKVRPGVFEGFKFTGQSKQQLMEGLAVAIAKREVGHPAAPEVGAGSTGDVAHLELELESFEYQHGKTGTTYEAPQGFNDDCVCAYALAVMHKSHARAPMRISPAALKASASAGGHRR